MRIVLNERALEILCRVSQKSLPESKFEHLRPASVDKADFVMNDRRVFPVHVLKKSS